MRAVKDCEIVDLPCREKMASKVNIEWTLITSCVKHSFEKSEGAIVENTLLKEEREHWQRYANHFSPSITIDGWQYRVSAV